MYHRVDAVDGVFGEPPIRTKTVRAVSFLGVAIIQARGVHAFATALAAAAAGVDLDRDPIADLEFIDAGAEPNHCTHVFVTRCEAPIEGKPAIDHRRQTVPDDLDIGSTDCNRVDPH